MNSNSSFTELFKRFVPLSLYEPDEDDKGKYLFLEQALLLPPLLHSYTHFPSFLVTLSIVGSVVDSGALNCINMLCCLQEFWLVNSMVFGDDYLDVRHNVIQTICLIGVGGLRSLGLVLPNATRVCIRDSLLEQVELSMHKVTEFHLSGVPKLELSKSVLTEKLSGLRYLKVSAPEVLLWVLSSMNDPSSMNEPSLRGLELSEMNMMNLILAGCRWVQEYPPPWDGRTTDLVWWFQIVGDAVLPNVLRVHLASLRYLNLTGSDANRLILGLFAYAVPNLQKLVMRDTEMGTLEEEDSIHQVLGNFCRCLSRRLIDDGQVGTFDP